jgi:hypothetical protein
MDSTTGCSNFRIPDTGVKRLGIISFPKKASNNRTVYNIFFRNVMRKKRKRTVTWIKLFHQFCIIFI